MNGNPKKIRLWLSDYIVFFQDFNDDLMRLQDFKEISIYQDFNAISKLNWNFNEISRFKLDFNEMPYPKI